MAGGFLPVSRQDMQAQGIEQLDFVYICGDAYVDHPSFGSARPLFRVSCSPEDIRWE